MTIDHRVQQLQREFGFHPDIAHAMAEADGACCYCGEDLLASRPGYSSISRDRLVPDYRGDENNYVLACTSCNQMKDGFSPLHRWDDADDMLRENKVQLILRVRTHLQKKILVRKSEWYRVRDIIKGGDGARAAHAAEPASGGVDGYPSRTMLRTIRAVCEGRDEGPSRTRDGRVGASAAAPTPSACARAIERSGSPRSVLNGIAAAPTAAPPSSRTK